MAGQIFLIGDEGHLQPMEERAYEQEDVFQTLLEDYPDLLAGDQIAPDSPLRWLLVTREASIPGREDGAGRWALDHLFLDQHGVPTLVEVKRSSDTRLRREVVGQMLDYAANAVVYWPAGRIRDTFEDKRRQDDEDPDEVLTSRLGLTEEEIETYWQRVDTNLKAGNVRLLFVADDIPLELQRIVEFLNEQMSPAEVLAIEIKQFVGGAVRTLVPRVVGKTAGAEMAKSASRGRSTTRWTPERIKEWAAEEAVAGEAESVPRLVALAEDHGSSIYYGGGVEPGFAMRLALGDRELSVWTMTRGANGQRCVALRFGYLAREAGEEVATRFRALVGGAGGAFADVDPDSGYPRAAPIADFTDDDFARLESITLEMKQLLADAGATPNGE